jgi:hypothetical protein
MRRALRVLRGGRAEATSVYYCPECGRVITQGFPGSVCYHGRWPRTPVRMKPRA